MTNLNDINIYDGKPHTYLGQVATATMLPNAQNTTASETMMTRKAHYARDSIRFLQLVFANWFLPVGANALIYEKNNGNALTIKAWIEYPAGTYTALTSGGSTSMSATDFTNLLTDTLAISIPANALFYTWTYVVPSGGNNFPYYTTAVAGNPLFYTGTGNLGEAAVLATSGVPTTPGAITDNFTGRRGYWPVAILSQTAKKSYFLLGDSRTAGVLDVADVSVDLGNMARSIGPTRAYINTGVSGMLVSSFVSSNTLRLQLAGYCSHILDELAVNGFYQQITQNSICVQAYKQRCAKLFNNGNYLFTTIEPLTTSSDSWATASNQTLYSSSAVNAARVAYNDWIRTQPSNVSYLEIANVMESNNVGNGTPTQDGGYWLATGIAGGYTSDGIHEKQAGNLLIAASGNINPTVIEASSKKVTVPPLSLTMSSLSGTAITYTTGEFSQGVATGYPYIFGVIPGCPPYTFECWAKIATPATGYVLGGGPAFIQSLTTSGFAQVRVGSGSSSASTVNICDNVFHHLAVTITLTGTVTLYVDGNSAATISLSLTSPNWSNEFDCFMVKATGHITTFVSPGTPSAAIVDEVALWNTVKYTGNFTPPTQPYVGNEANLIALWHFDNSLAGIAGPAF